MATKTETVEDPKLKKLVRVYLKMKAKRDLITEAFKKEDADLEKQMSAIKDALLGYCKETGLEGARTTEGTFFRTVQTRYGTNDWSAFGQFAIEHNAVDLYEKRLHQGNVKQFMEENPDTALPGLVTDSKYSISIRRK